MDVDKKGFIKSGLIFGMAGSIFFAVQHLVTEDHLTTNRVLTIIGASLAGGIAGGLVFALIMTLFLQSRFVRNAVRIDLAPGETIQFQTPANHFKGIEAVGGLLYLTNRRLIFKSHKLNIQNHELSIDLSDIKKTDRFRTFGMINNGLMVETGSGGSEKFVVNDAANWIIQLTTGAGLTA